MPKANTDLLENFRNVTDRIRAAEFKAGREAGSVNLVAVSKLHPVSAVRTLSSFGQKAFAENFVQEALVKQQATTDLDIEWHFIGSIQSNKTSDIANNFSWVHSIDRYKIVRRLNDQRAEKLPPLNVCLQLNLQDEDTKSGLSKGAAAQLLAQTQQLPNIKVRGFMIIPKPTDNPNEQRPVFAEVSNLLDRFNAKGYQLDTLSMGMTADLEQAIMEGSTHVRIGTALFGARPPKST